MVARRAPLPLLPVKEDAERRERGVSLEEWLEAPSPPDERWECADPNGELELRNPSTRTVELVPARPCPALRCKHHLGVRGTETCRLDVAARPDDERTYDAIALAAGIQQEKAVQVYTRVRDRNERDNGDTRDVPPEQELAIRLGIVRRPKGQR